MTHLDDETLSAFIDGELEAAAGDAARAHAASCAECRARLERLRAASAAFRRAGERELPLGFTARVKAKVLPVRRSIGAALAFAVFCGGLVLIFGVALKKFMPTLFINVQQMITGAASQMGSGGK